MALSASEALVAVRSILNLLDSPGKQDWVAEQIYMEYVGYLSPDEEPAPCLTVLASKRPLAPRVCDTGTSILD